MDLITLALAKNYTDKAIEKNSGTGGGDSPDLSNYVTKDQMEEAIAAALANLGIAEEGVY